MLFRLTAGGLSEGAREGEAVSFRSSHVVASKDDCPPPPPRILELEEQLKCKAQAEALLEKQRQVRTKVNTSEVRETIVSLRARILRSN